MFTDSAGDDYYSLHLIGSDGAAYADDHHNQPLLRNSDGRTLPDRDFQRDPATAMMLAEFVAGIQEDRAWQVGIEDSLAAALTRKEAGDA